MVKFQVRWSHPMTRRNPMFGGSIPCWLTPPLARRLDLNFCKRLIFWWLNSWISGKLCSFHSNSSCLNPQIACLKLSCFPVKSPVFFVLNIHMLHIFRLPAGSVQKCWIPKNCRLHRDREWGLKHQNYGWSILHCLNPIQFSIVKSSSWMVKIPWKSHIFHRKNPFLNPMFVGFFINFKPALSHRIGWWENFNRKAQTIWW